jgi:phage internal scaffolding protein
MKHKFRTQFERRVVKTSFKGVKSLTDQQYKDDCSIEGIVKRYGILPAPDVKPFNADVSEYGDFADCMNRVQDGLDKFGELPSAVRERFGNDPKVFFSWISNPENLKEAVKLGLAVEKVVKPDTVEILSDIRDTLKNDVNSKESKKA